MKSRLFSALAILLVASFTVVAADTQLNEKVDLTDVKCVVASRDAQASKSAEYKDAHVYFCCNGCAGKFEANTKKYATQANRQLVQTGQYKQTGCPISGRDVDPETMITVDATKVGFCCGNCKAKVEGAEPKEASQMVFGEKAFAKAYKKADQEG